MDKIVYLDNAATSWPKPPCVIKAMKKFIEEEGGNPGRSGHRLSIQALRRLDDTREALASMFGARNPLSVVFTSGLTEAVNLVVFGYLRDGDKVVTTTMEHNSVLRPLYVQRERGVEVAIVKCNVDGSLDLERIHDAIDGNTKLVAITHASNVTGNVMPIADVAKMAHEKGASILVDAGQTGGCIPVNVEEEKIDFLAFAGHKGLLGPPGTGGLIIGERVDIERLTPLKFGGSGGRSESKKQPGGLPDKYESGTLNGVGIAGLGASTRLVLSEGIDVIRAREKLLLEKLLTGLTEIDGVTVYGPLSAEACAPVVSFNVGGMTPQIVGTILDEEYGILARAGLQCSPLAHETIGTSPNGAVRFGIGYYTETLSLDHAIDAVGTIASKAR
ncbi:MAG: aminotransferase class V-fold PLP-dependent enzyme [Candidatus Glassbacteria bacterium]